MFGETRIQVVHGVIWVVEKAFIRCMHGVFSASFSNPVL